MREELTSVGVRELMTPADVDGFMAEAKSGTSLLVVNSVCGCAAGQARPAIRHALAGGPKPDRVATVFAGQEVEATQRARGFFPHIPPSSPSVALFKDGELVWFLPRHRIESRDAESVARDITEALVEHCATTAA
jgi:putative YphP/YqiW family bacilliredoxin